MLRTLEGGEEASVFGVGEGGIGTLVRRVNKAGVGVVLGDRVVFDQAGCCELW